MIVSPRGSSLVYWRVHVFGTRLLRLVSLCTLFATSVASSLVQGVASCIEWPRPLRLLGRDLKAVSDFVVEVEASEILSCCCLGTTGSLSVPYADRLKIQSAVSPPSDCRSIGNDSIRDTESSENDFGS